MLDPSKDSGLGVLLMCSLFNVQCMFSFGFFAFLWPYMAYEHPESLLKEMILLGFETF